MKRRGPLDPRIPYHAYEAGESYGQPMNRLIDGVDAVCPRGDVLRVWDRLTDELYALDETDAFIFATVARYVEAHPRVFFTD